MESRAGLLRASYTRLIVLGAASSARTTLVAGLTAAQEPIYLLGALMVMALAFAAVAIISPGANGNQDRAVSTAAATPEATPGVQGEAPDAGGTPRLTLDRELIDLGDAKLGIMVEASFVLTNTGGQLLRLSEPPYIELVEGC